MNEADWLACADPERMLEFLRGKASDRKLRLFVCACCRRVWNLLTDERSGRAVETAERYADGLATERQLAIARLDALRAAERYAGRAAWAPYWAAVRLVADAVWNAATAASEGGTLAAAGAARAGNRDEVAAWAAGRAVEANEQARLLRDVFGNPFHAVAFDPSWLTWHDGAVRKMAQAVYDDRAFDRLPLLADALEDAGCESQELLDHCRAGGEHVRGCWAVDLLLRKS